MVAYIFNCTGPGCGKKVTTEATYSPSDPKNAQGKAKSAAFNSHHKGCCSDACMKAKVAKASEDVLQFRTGARCNSLTKTAAWANTMTDSQKLNMIIMKLNHH